MEAEHEDVIVLSKLNQGGAKHRTTGKVKWTRHFFVNEALSLSLTRRDDQRQIDCEFGGDDLYGLIVEGYLIRGAQDFVAHDDLIQGILQGVNIEATREPDDMREVEQRGVRIQLIEEP